jgi:hypothetical protein
LLAQLQRSLAARGIDFRIASAHGKIREALRRSGFEKLGGAVEANQTISAVMSGWIATKAPVETVSQ